MKKLFDFISLGLPWIGLTLAVFGLLIGDLISVFFLAFWLWSLYQDWKEFNENSKK